MQLRFLLFLLRFYKNVKNDENSCMELFDDELK
jgi:hypothetical protein